MKAKDEIDWASLETLEDWAALAGSGSRASVRDHLLTGDTCLMEGIADELAPPPADDEE